MFSRFKNSVWNIMDSYVLAPENRTTLFISGGLALLGAGLNLFYPYVLGQTIGMFASEAATGFILGFETEAYVMIGIGSLSYAASKGVESLRNEVLAPITTRTFAKAVSDYSDCAVHRSMEQKSAPGEDLTRVQKGLGGIVSFSTQVCNQFVPILISTVSSATMLSTQYGVKYGAILIGAVFPCVAYNVKNTQKIINLRSKAIEENNKGYNALMLTVDHPLIIQSFIKEEDEKKRSRDAQVAVSVAELESSRFGIRTARYQEFGLNIILLGVSLWVGNDVLSKRLQPGAFATIQALMMQNFAGISAFSQATAAMVSGARDAKPFFDYLKTPPDIIDKFPNNHLKLSSSNASVEFENISFSYKSKPNVQVLKNVSCLIKPGLKIGIAGGTGSGKSTLGKLLFRYLNPTGGKIRVGGIDIDKVSLTSLRKHIGIIEQNPVLLPGTLLENVLYGCAELSGSPKKKAIENVLKAAHLDVADIEKQKKEAEEKSKLQTKVESKSEFKSESKEIKLEVKEVKKTRIDSFPNGSPESALINEVRQALNKARLTDYVDKNGLLTPIHERGSNLSGGQVQRLAIARVLMRGDNLKFLLLDEATSALDAENEFQIQANIDEICQQLGVTQIWITHHLINLVNANNIFVLEQGRIVEEGTHRQLIAKQGVYSKLWASQNPGHQIETKGNSQEESKPLSFAIGQGNHSPRLFQEVKSSPLKIVVPDEEVVVNVHWHHSPK